MNWVDLVIIAVLVIFALQGLGRRLLGELFDLAGFLLAFFISLKYYNLVAIQLKSLFSLPHSFSNVLGFIAVWYLVEILFFIFSRIALQGLGKIPRLPGEKFVSVIPAYLRGMIFVSIILVLVGTFPIQPRIKEEVSSSRLGPWILAQTYQIEGPLKNVFGGLANDTLTFLTIRPEASESVNLGFRNDKFYFDESIEFAMITLINDERIEKNLSPLSFDENLRGIARGHSGDMFARGYFSHNTPEGYDLSFRAKETGVNFLVLGENLAYAPTLELAHRGLMNSPGHRANILSGDYSRVGIGVANGGAYGLMFTQVFRN